jgi:hypothetical protein
MKPNKTYEIKRNYYESEASRAVKFGIYIITDLWVFA